MNNITFVSYCTPKYQEIFDKFLFPSLLKFKLPYFIQSIEDLGSWKLNTDFKPKFLLKCLENLENDIVFIDSDATINSYPELFYSIPEDLGVHYLDWESHYGRESDKGILECLTGTLFLRNNDKIKSFLKEWIKETKNFVWEQKAFEKVLKFTSIEYYLLPREYCYLVSTPWGNPAQPLTNPIISHYQMSRKLK